MNHEAEKWMNVTRTKEDEPKLTPAIGVKIEVRVVVRQSTDWSEIEEILQKARDYGAADVVEYKVFE